MKPGVEQPDEKYSRTYFDLLSALRQPDCAVCRLVGDAALRYVDILIYENITNIARRRDIREARGFCSPHTSMFMSGFGRLLSMATLEQDILNDVLRNLRGAPAGRPKAFSIIGALFRRTKHSVRAAILPARQCPICEYEHSQERVMLGTLIQFIDNGEMREALEASAALCLPHYTMALGMRGNLAPIIKKEEVVLKQVKRDVDAYVHKRNPAYSHEEMGEEIDVPARAARLISGRILHRDGRW